jgi:formylglycine-generating enzyme required for sulfatase activity
MTSCGAGGGGTASCCSTGTEVPNGAFYRSYDGVTPGYESKAYPAIVSAFRLDAYEVTVGRFRRFVDQVVRGWLPSPGSGKHTELFGGTGLETTSGGHEGGWDSAWDSTLSTTAGAWNTNLSGGTWTPSVGSNENLPISQITWYEAYAFCIWDDAFLPSEAEWDYAAAGGSDQRVRPWSIPGSTGISCLQANYGSCTTQTANAVGSESPAGDGKWGHSDLGGNVWEWTLDYYASYAPECMDCANLTPGSNRVLRGGSFHASASLVLASNRFSAAPTARLNDVGTRCARTP